MNQIDIIDDLEMPQVVEVVQMITQLEEDSYTVHQGTVIKGIPMTILFNISTNEGPGLTRSWFDVIPVVDTISRSSRQIFSKINGICANSIVLINIVCCHRTMSKHGYIIIDPLTASGGLWGNIESQNDEVSNHNSLLKQIHSIFKEYTKMDSKMLAKVLKKNMVFDSSLALQYGLVDEIV